MITFAMLKELAFSFPEVTEEPHFEKISFQVKKKIFVAWNENINKATIKLSEIDQAAFLAASGGTISPVNNKWGKQGWTTIDMKRVNADLFKDAVTTSYCQVAPKKLAKMVRPSELE